MRNSRLFCYLDGDTVWEYLETGKDIDKLYPDEFREEIQISKLEKEISNYKLENEEWYLFPVDGRYRDYAVTSFGRAFNLNMKRQLRANWQIADEQIYFFIRESKCFLKPVFDKMGWTYDNKTIFDFYKSQGQNIYKYGIRKSIYVMNT